MRRTLFLTLIIVCLYSCQKEVTITPSFIPKLQSQLRLQMNEHYYQQLDFTKVIRSFHDSSSFIRIGFLNELMQDHFVLLKMDTGDRTAIAGGAIISLRRDGDERHPTNFSKYSLAGTLEIQSSITDGYIDAYHPLTRGESTEDPYKLLPEVIVVSSYATTRMAFSSEWYYLEALLGIGSGGGSGSGQYGMADPPMGGGGGNYVPGGYTGGPVVPPPMVEEEMMEVDYEQGVNDPAIQLEDYLKCFESIPNSGAKCSIEIFSDIPVDNDPHKLFNWKSGSPGHTFLQIKKQNMGKSVVLNVGFYPKTAFKVTATTAPIDGKFVDNKEHEFNASFKVSVTADEFASGIKRMKDLGNVKYDVDDFNCTDWALDIFNFMAPKHQLDIPRYQLPESPSFTGSNTPQGLYIKLKEMKINASGGGGEINVPKLGWVGQSDGPCK